MDIIGNRLMASQIEKTIEIPQEQKVIFKLMFPVDFANNNFEVRYLKFFEVTFYLIEEILVPFGRPSQINHINELENVSKTIIESEKVKFEIKRRSFEILTNGGKRTINFSNYEFTED